MLSASERSGVKRNDETMEQPSNIFQAHPSKFCVGWVFDEVGLGEDREIYVICRHVPGTSLDANAMPRAFVVHTTRRVCVCARVENVCVRADGYEFAAANRSDLPANGGVAARRAALRAAAVTLTN